MSVTALSAGVQQLYNQGLLPSGVNPSVLSSASSAQLNQLVTSSVAQQQVAALLGIGASSTDSASLSSTATNSLLQEINPTSTTNSSSTDPITAAVNNELTSSLNAAVSKFLPQSSTTSGSQINVVG